MTFPAFSGENDLGRVSVDGFNAVEGWSRRLKPGASPRTPGLRRFFACGELFFFGTTQPQPPPPPLPPPPKKRGKEKRKEKRKRKEKGKGRKEEKKRERKRGKEKRKEKEEAQSAVRGADRCGRVCQVTLSVHSIDADDIFGILSAS